MTTSIVPRTIDDEIEMLEARIAADTADLQRLKTQLYASEQGPPDAEEDCSDLG